MSSDTFEKKIITPLTNAICIVFVIYQIVTISGLYVLDTSIQRAFHLGFVMALTFLIFPIYGKSNSFRFLRVVDFICCILAFVIASFFYVYFDYIFDRLPYVDPLTDVDMFIGVAAILLVLEITRRTSGIALVIVATCGLLYTYFGDYLPGFLHHSGKSVEEIVEHVFLLTDGIYGVPLSNAATIIFAFVLFGAFLEKSGMNDLFMNLACYWTKNAKGGPAKVAIFGSAMFGTISGSAVANVYGTGNITIPMMQKVGYKPAFAGAVEAVVSTGGQIMPPVMGSAAFIMADITGVGYLAVAKAALLPAILYYASLFFMIHFEACKHNAGTIPPEMIPDVRRIYRQIYYVSAILLLIVLMVMGCSPVFSALLSTLSIYLMSFIRKDTRMGIRKLYDTFVFAAKNSLMITSCCACAGIVVGVITLTGLGFTFINFVSSVAGDNRFIILVLIMLVCIIMGMGVPTAPAYILVASLGAPLIIKSGFSVVSAHLFVLYYAVLSVITPPVCLASYAGAAIADASAMRTGMVGMKLACVSFIIPFMFIYQPNLLLEGDWFSLIQAACTSFLGVISIAAGVQGYFKTNANIVERALFIVGGFMMVDSGKITDVIGIACIVLAVASQIIKCRAAGKCSMETENITKGA